MLHVTATTSIKVAIIESSSFALLLLRAATDYIMQEQSSIAPTWAPRNEAAKCEFKERKQMWQRDTTVAAACSR